MVFCTLKAQNRGEIAVEDRKEKKAALQVLPASVEMHRNSSPGSLWPKLEE